MINSQRTQGFSPQSKTLILINSLSHIFHSVNLRAFVILRLMIHLEILTSSDSLAVGLYDFEYDHVHIGRSKKNDLIFVEKELPASYMKIEIVEDSKGSHLVARTLNRFPYFFINGKKISGVIKLRINDIISFGENKIKILSYKKTHEAEDMAQAFDSFAKNANELRFALDFIEEVLLDHEKVSDV